MLIKSHLDLSYHELYVSDIRRTVKWYYQVFGFQLLSIGSDFVTLQIAPGRLIFVRLKPNQQGFLGLKTGNIKDVINQLEQAKIDYVFPDDSHTWFQLKDPDDNLITVMPGVFGMEDLEFLIPDKYIKRRVIHLESKEELHLIVNKISDQGEFSKASDELISLCRQYGLTTEGIPFTVSKFTKQIDAMYACIAVLDAPIDPMQDGIQYIQIPRHEYVVISLTDEDFRENYVSYHGWMNNCLSKGDTIYILEYYDDEYTHVFMPYIWRES